MPKPPHFGELDSLRGLAALVVVFHHFVLLGAPTAYSKFLLHVVANGHSAVMLFFILSGFVLALPIARGTAQIYSSFLVRRVCRIYLPYLAALAIALAADALFHNRHLLSPFVAHSWSVPISLKLIAQHVAFIGDYEFTQVNPAFWSLVHEMRISLIFPPFCLALYRLRLAAALALLAVLTVVGSLLGLRMPSEATTFVTLHYLAIFGLGALLARHMLTIANWYNSLGRATKCGVALLAVLLYVARTEGMASKIGSLADLPVALGATLLVILSLNSGTLKASLNHRLPAFLGRVSYSLYLIHVTVLFVLLHFFARRSPLFLLLYLTGAIGGAYILWKYVEQPSILLGKRLSHGAAKPRAATTTGMPIGMSPVDVDAKNIRPEERPELLMT